MKIFIKIISVFILNKLLKEKLKKFYKRAFIKSIIAILEKRDGLVAQSKKINTLVVGSSHGDCGFNPYYFNEYSYNFCSPSQDLYYSYEVCKKYHNELPKLKNIILFYSLFSAGLELNRTSESERCLIFKKALKINYKENIRFHWLDILNVSLNVRKKYDFSKEFYNGYKISKVSLDLSLEERVSKHEREGLRNNDQLDYVEKLYQLCKQNGYRLTVVIPPMTNEYRQHCKWASKIYCKLNNFCDERFKILDFFESSFFSSEDFYDYDHLNSRGAKKLTELIQENGNF